MKYQSEEQKSLVRIHSWGILLFVISAVMTNLLGGCEAYNFSNCSLKKLLVFIIFFFIGLLPVIGAIYLNRVTSALLLIYSILISILAFPFGSIVGVLSFIKLRAHQKSIQQQKATDKPALAVIHKQRVEL